MQKIKNIEEAITAIEKGKEEGLNFLFHQLYSSLTYFAFTFLSNKEQAEEIASQAFLKLWNNRTSISNPATLKSWLYTIVKNACIDQLRKEKSLSNKIIQAKKSDDVEEPVINKIIEAETLNHILHSLSKLPPKCSQVFQLFYLHEKSYTEIATLLNISEHTARNQKFRALRLLKTKLDL